MSAYVTSDYHFGSWKGLSCFKVMSTEQEDDAIAKWNSIVKDDDIVYYLGDFCDSGLEDCIQYRKKLNGDIILVKGNHDILPDGIGWTLFKGIVNSKMWIGDVQLQHCPDIGANGKQLFGHVHRDGITDPFYLADGLCVCATMHGNQPLLLEDAINAISTRRLQV